MHFNYLILSDEFDTFLLMGMIYDAKTFDMLCRPIFKSSEIRIDLNWGSLSNDTSRIIKLIVCIRRKGIILQSQSYITVMQLSDIFNLLQDTYLVQESRNRFLKGQRRYE